MNEQSQSVQIDQIEEISQFSVQQRQNSNYETVNNEVFDSTKQLQKFFNETSTKQNKNNSKTQTFENDPKIKTQDQQNQIKNFLKTQQKYLQQYMQFFQLNNKDLQQFHQKNINWYKTKIKQANIEICDSYQDQFTILQMLQSRNFQIVEFSAQMGFFKMNITVFNTTEQEIIENEVPLFNFGGFGQIYLCHFRNQNYALKSMSLFQKSISNYQKFKSNFLETLRQYFVARIFCALQIGPKIVNIFGFDLLMNFKALYFSMEICHTNAKFNSEQIKSNIKLIHSLRIVHKDIKPGNLMYSPFFKKWVFIDFGSVNFIKQDLGYRSFAKFYGTIKYSSQQMLFFKQTGLSLSNKKWIDLYYNDIHGYRITQKQATSLSQNLKNMVFVNENKQQSMIAELSDFKYYLIACKYLMWVNEISKLLYFIQINDLRKVDEFQQQILYFLKELSPTFELVQFYKNHLSSNSKDSEQFSYLSSIYVSDFTFTYQYKNTQDKVKKQFTHFVKFYLDFSLQFEPNFVSKRKLLTFQNIFQLQERQKLICKSYRSKLTNLQEILKISTEEYHFQLLDYISFYENYFKSSIIQKKQACKIFFKFMNEQIQKIDIEKEESLEIIYKTFIYLLRHGSQNIKAENKYRFYFSLLINCCILYSQFNLQEVISHKCTWIQNLPFYQKFTIFWLFQQNVSPQKQFEMFGAEVTSYKNLIQKMDQSTQNMMSLLEFKQNNNVQENINIRNLRKDTSNVLINKCKNTKIHKIIDDFKQHQAQFKLLTNKSYAQFVISLMICFKKCQIQHKESTQNRNDLSYFKILKLLSDRQSCKYMLMTYKYNQHSMYINTLITQAYQARKYKKLKNLINYTDEIINCQEITQNLNLQKKLALSYIFHDNQGILKIFNRIFNLDNKNSKNKNQIQNQKILFTYYSELCKMLQALKVKEYYLKSQISKQLQSPTRLIAKVLNQKYKEIQPKVQKNIKEILFEQNPNKSKLNTKKLSILRQLLYFFRLEFRLTAFSANFIKQQKGESFFNRLVIFFNQIKLKMLTIDQDPYLIEMYILIVNEVYCLSNRWEETNKQIQFLQTVRPEIKNLLNQLKNQPALQVYHSCYIVFSYYSKKFIHGEQIQNSLQLITFYFQILRRNQMQILYDFFDVSLQIWKSLLICERTNKQKAQFIFKHIRFLQKYQSFPHIKVFQNTFSKIFLQEKILNKKIYDPVKFIDFLLNQIEIQKRQFLQNLPCKNKYFCLIAYFCLFNQSLDQQTQKKLIMHIYRGIKNIKLEVRDIILQNLPLMLQKIKKQKRNKKIYLRRYPLIILKKIQKLKTIIKNEYFLQAIGQKIKKLININSE